MSQEMRKSDPSDTRSFQALDPFGGMRSELDRVFENFLGRRWAGLPSVFGDQDNGLLVPKVDVRETSEHIVVEAELPGMEEKDVDVTLRNGMLTIKGEKKSERQTKKDDYHTTERSYGRFERSFRLPDTVDEEKIAAKLEKGVLHVTLPKRPEAVKAEKKIPIGR